MILSLKTGFICEQSACVCCYSILANTQVLSQAVVKFKTIHWCSCCTALDLSDCLTHTVGERKTFQRMSVSGQTGLMKSLYQTTRMFPFIPLPPFTIIRELKNKYLQWAVRHCWNIRRAVWYEKSLDWEFQNEGPEFVGTFFECIIAALFRNYIVKSLDFMLYHGDTKVGLGQWSTHMPKHTRWV